ncbi:MAG: flagellar export protein FliJ [Planctomycetes bacterium]|nr:flagellar export protein FliJ [Planctomycetota bacterium]
MKGYHFRLARLMRVRDVEERTAKERFLAADRIAREAEDAVVRARDAVRDAEGDLRAAQADRALSPTRVLTTLDALAGLRARVRVLHERSLPLRAAAEVERAAWSERRRDLRGLERLEDRDRERWRAEEGRREARTLDEVAAMRAEARDRAAASMERASRSMNPGTTP